MGQSKSYLLLAILRTERAERTMGSGMMRLLDSEVADLAAFVYPQALVIRSILKLRHCGERLG